MIVYMLAFAIASLSFIAIDDLKISRHNGVTASHSTLKKNKLSRDIKYLYLKYHVKKRKLNRT
jgi:hypothetical protein